jgi:CubicO group peptidase (beta-lactamase class C family)
MDSDLLVEAVDHIRERDLPLHSVLAVRHGYMVLDAYFGLFEPGWKHDVASVTKSFTSTLVGIAIQEGKIEGVEKSMLSFFPDRTAANLDAQKQAVTLEHLLTMRAGLVCQNSPTEVTLFEMMASPDWVQFVLDQPMAAAPGTEFVYNSTASHFLSAIVRKTTGMRAADFAEARLFEPLGINDVIWPSDPQGLDSTGWGSLRITPHDMARFGYLFLHNGRWDGTQIVPEAWVKTATTPHVVFTENEHYAGYGYHWWIRLDGFVAQGRGGQRIFVVPDKDLVVVFTGGGQGYFAEEMLDRFILPAVKSDEALPEPAIPVDLIEPERARAKPVEAVRPRRLPRIARKISGKTYKIRANPLGIQSIRFLFEDKEEALFELRIASHDIGRKDRKVTVRAGLDGVPRLSPGRFGLPAAATGEWRDKDVLILDYNELGNINHWRLRGAFDDDSLELMMADLTGLGRHRLTGRMVE